MTLKADFPIYIGDSSLKLEGCIVTVYVEDYIYQLPAKTGTGNVVINQTTALFTNEETRGVISIKRKGYGDVKLKVKIEWVGNTGTMKVEAVRLFGLKKPLECFLVVYDMADNPLKDVSVSFEVPEWFSSGTTNAAGQVTCKSEPKTFDMTTLTEITVHAGLKGYGKFKTKSGIVWYPKWGNLKLDYIKLTKE